MIKIEKLSKDAKASITRVTVSGDSKISVYAGMLMNHAELETINIESGSVTYSIDETEVITKNAKSATLDTVHSNSNTVHTTIDTDSTSSESSSPVSDIDSISNTSKSTGIGSTADTDSNIVGSSEVLVKKPAKSVGRTVKAK